jgi:protein arginine phosphatase
LLSILFICTGNTCRSPLAEYLLRYYLEQETTTFEVKVLSAGLYARGQKMIAAEASKLLDEEKIRHDPRRLAIPVHNKIVNEADLILAMTADQLRQISFRFPEASSKSFLLKEYCDLGGGDIEDPIGGGAEKYRQVLEDIRPAVKNLLMKLSGL